MVYQKIFVFKQQIKTPTAIRLYCSNIPKLELSTGHDQLDKQTILNSLYTLFILI